VCMMRYSRTVNHCRSGARREPSTL
jgi:hypothetical protein